MSTPKFDPLAGETDAAAPLMADALLDTPVPATDDTGDTAAPTPTGGARPSDTGGETDTLAALAAAEEAARAAKKAAKKAARQKRREEKRAAEGTAKPKRKVGAKPLAAAGKNEAGAGKPAAERDAGRTLASKSMSGSKKPSAPAAPAPQAAPVEPAGVDTVDGPADSTGDDAFPFDAFGLDSRLIDNVKRLGFKEPTDIQSAAIPAILTGKDVIGGARTGSGKTAAFGLPLLQRIKGKGKGVRGLVLAPTRELAIQVSDALQDFAAGTPLRIATLYGGSAYGPQISALRAGVGIVVGTPGRTLDHLRQGRLDLSNLDVFVLDEADEMLRMGFIDDVKELLSAANEDRQVALFSATMPPVIRAVANEHLTDPLEIQVESRGLSVTHIEQQYMVVPAPHRFDVLERLFAVEDIKAAIVFARTRADTMDIAAGLDARGHSAEALHGDMTQAARERVLMRLRKGRVKIVVATDVAARGIDVEHVSHVINVEMPFDTEAYVHRIGRTGRAGREGKAITLVPPAGMRRLGNLERHLKVRLDKRDVPSDAEVAESRYARLRERLEAAMRDTTEPGIDDILSGMDHTPAGDGEGVLGAALRLLAAQHNIDVTATPSNEPPPWARHRPREPRSQAGYAEVVLSVGKKAGLRVGDIVGAMTATGVLNGRDLGRITLLPHKTFVAVQEGLAERLLNDVRTIEIRGNAVSIERPMRGPRGGGPKRRPGPGGRGGPRRGPRR